MVTSRRKLLLAAGGVALTVLGAEGARRVWAQIADRVPPAESLGAGHIRMITVLADLILPATETPGAVDVGVPEWVAHVLSESFVPAVQQILLSGLDALDQRALGEFGRGISDLSPEQLQVLIDPLDRVGRFESFADRVVRVVGRRVSAGGALGGMLARYGLERRSFQEIKSLIIHGYFTSEKVQREVLKVQWA